MGGIADSGTVSYVFTQTQRYESTAWAEGRDRFPSGGRLVAVSAGTRRVLAADFAAAVDPAVSFDGSRILFAGKRLMAEPWQVWEVPVAGGSPRRVSSSKGDCVRPLYLPDGMVVYTRVSAGGSHLEVAPLTGGAGKRITFGANRVLTNDVLRDGRILFESVTSTPRVRELYTVYPDGTGVESMRCDHGADRGEARQLASGDVVFRVGERLARFTSTKAEQVPLPQVDRDVAGPVAEAPAGVWLIAVRGKSGRYGLHYWNTGTFQWGELDVLAGAHAVQPAILAARPAPLRFPSGLAPSRTTGNLLCLDARISKPAIEGAIRTVRFYTQGSGNTAVALGETAVESDGSFYVQLPADKPLRLELLGADGKLIRAEHGWFWMRPSEQRVCVGCHAGPERASENKVPAVLLRTTTPVNMLGTTGQEK